MAQNDYEKAKKLGEKAYKLALFKGQHPYLPVLDDIIEKESVQGEVSLGLVDVPLDRVIGTSTAGRTQAFANNFMPILDEKTEFGAKWAKLCEAHIEEGIHDPVKVYEYLNYFYVIEGNKRVSVLKYFGADSIPAFVTRKIPKYTDDKEIHVYYEFMDFNKSTGVNYIWLSEEGAYNELIDIVSRSKKNKHKNDDNITTAVGTVSDSMDGSGTVFRSQAAKVWSDDTLLEFRSAYYRFSKVYKEEGGDKLENITTGDAFLVMLKLTDFDTICELDNSEMHNMVDSMFQEFLLANGKEAPEISLDPPEQKRSIISHILPQYSASKPLKIGFIFDREPVQSSWLYAHELGRNYIKENFGDKVNTLKITTATNEQETMDAISDLVNSQGTEVIFTTTSKMIDASVKSAIKYPNVKILNCSLNTSHRYIRTYYARLYESKFLAGMVAGSLTETNKIGYIENYPIVGVMANINAFALGAKLVNPKAKVMLKWASAKEYQSREEIYNIYRAEGVDYVSDQDMITPNKASRNFGMYKLTDDEPINMTMTVYDWGVLYDKILNIILNGNWNSTDTDQDNKALNYWWGMSAGVVDIIISDKVPVDTRRLVNIFRQMIIDDKYSPFIGEIVDQNGEIISKEGELLPTDDIITMDWLVDNVDGYIPSMDELKEKARPIVEIKGVKKMSNEDTNDSGRGI